MDNAQVFARHYGRLMWLLLHAPEKVEQLQGALRAATAACAEGPVRLAVRESRLTGNGEPVAAELAGSQELVAQMVRHSVRQIHADGRADAVDLLAAARVLADKAVQRDGGLAALGRLREMKSRTVRFDVDVDPKALRAAATPLRVAAVAARAEADVAALATELEILEPEEAHAAVAEKSGAGIVRQEDDAFSHAFIGWASPSARMGSFLKLVAAGEVAPLFAELDAADSVALKAQMLDEMAGLAERAARDGRSLVVANVLAGVAARERAETLPEVKKTLGHTWRRLAKQSVLRQVAAILPRKWGPTEEYEAVLLRAGEEGAEAIIDQLTEATTAEDRRIFYDALLRLKVGVPSLLHMLGDPRWYVVRNAADLLGEMRAEEAEPPLVEHLRHADLRVRGAACTALVRIGSPGALRAVREAVRDPAPEVRELAVGALAERGDDGLAAMALVRALECEEDEAVLFALVAALGRVATTDAVQRLVAIAEPGGRIFNKKSTAFRVAAVHALGEARTAATKATLTALTEDREREVRDAAVRALSRA